MTSTCMSVEHWKLYFWHPEFGFLQPENTTGCGITTWEGSHIKRTCKEEQFLSNMKAKCLLLLFSGFTPVQRVILTRRQHPGQSKRYNMVVHRSGQVPPSATCMTNAVSPPHPPPVWTPGRTSAARGQRSILFAQMDQSPGCAPA